MFPSVFQISFKITGINLSAHSVKPCLFDNADHIPYLVPYEYLRYTEDSEPHEGCLGHSRAKFTDAI